MERSPDSSGRSFTPPFSWRQGEHVALLGQTQSGKSTFASNLLSLRQYVIVLKTKGDRVKYEVDVTAQKASAMDTVAYRRILLAPKPKPRSIQRLQIEAALEKVWEQKGWTVYIDELFYHTETLKIEEPVERLLTQGASQKITVVSAMQRPARISRFAISESTHVVSFFLEGRDRKIVKDAGSELLAEAVSTLDRYEFAWLYRPTREVYVGRIQDLGGKP